MAGAYRRNVQEQNLDTREDILRVAREFRRDPERFPSVIHALRAHSLDPGKGILVEYADTPDQGGYVHYGCWLTDDRKFFTFAVLIPFNRSAPPDVEEWREVTEEIVINAHMPGTGKSFGWLALDVQANELAP